VDDGACLWRALDFCVPGCLTKEELDAQIQEVYIEQNKKPEWTPDKFKLEWCGIEQESWHLSCIPKALRVKYGADGFLWQRQRNNNIIFSPKRNKLGKFFVHALLNSERYAETEEEAAGDWRHCVCVDTDIGKFYDESCVSGRDVKKWFKCRNIRDRYLSEIYRVYKLEILEEVSEEEEEPRTTKEEKARQKIEQAKKQLEQMKKKADQARKKEQWAKNQMEKMAKQMEDLEKLVTGGGKEGEGGEGEGEGEEGEGGEREVEGGEREVEFVEGTPPPEQDKERGQAEEPEPEHTSTDTAPNSPKAAPEPEPAAEPDVEAPAAEPAV
jgi:hypothetical protein